MPGKTFCTIVSAGYLPYAQVLYDSIRNFDKDIHMNVFVADFEKLQLDISDTSNFFIHRPDEIYNRSIVAEQIWEKYNTPDTQSELRWSSKSVFINYLFDKGYEKVIFTDADTYYFSDYAFLFEELNSYNVLLTPHWRGLEPQTDPVNFDLQFVGGLFNAGFIGVSKKAKDVMDWWGQACLYKCELDFSTGHYGDQIYLNLMPVYFDKVKIVKHQGCNVANWNIVVCSRELVEGNVKINGQWDIVFIHFTQSMFYGISTGRDGLLKPYMQEYLEKLENHGLTIKVNSEVSVKRSRSNYWKLKNWLNKKMIRIRQ